nr:YkgJ family cysteine cluster protein [Bacteroidota bacterium]
MLPAYKQILQQSISQKEETKKFLHKLKRAKPNDLDNNCNTLHYKAFENIDCLQCANCCITTGPLLLHKDIERLSQSLSMRQAAFTNQYLRQDEDGDLVFKNMPCPFLDEHSYCNVYEARPNACREYPHTQQRKIINKLDITFHNSTICPAVAKVVEGLKKIYGNT